jgi:hypothetical protein
MCHSHRDTNIPFIISLLLSVICLSIYVGALLREWGPVLRNQPFVASKVSNPLARDFPLHWTASFLALSGEPAAVYDFARLRSMEKTLTGSGPLPWPYPPSALLLDLPLALTPYLTSLALWLTITLGAYLLVLYRIAPHPLTIFWALAFFGTFANYCQGQNGFLSAALLGAGLLFLETNPWLSGIFLGLLSYKPHLAVLIPLALIVGREWRAFAGAIISGSSLIAMSALLFGVDLWRLFFQNISHSFNMLQIDSLIYAKMPSVYAACRSIGCDQSLSWVCQGSAMLSAIVLIIIIWSQRAFMALRAPSLVFAILLFPPYIWYYDLPILALLLAWIWHEGFSCGWLPGEQILLLWSWAGPLLTFYLSVDLKLPCGPLYLLFPFILLVQRFRGEQGLKSKFCPLTLTRTNAEIG